MLGSGNSATLTGKLFWSFVFTGAPSVFRLNSFWFSLLRWILLFCLMLSYGSWYYHDSFSVWMDTSCPSRHQWTVLVFGCLCESGFPDLDSSFLSFQRHFPFFLFLLEAWTSSEAQLQLQSHWLSWVSISGLLWPVVVNHHGFLRACGCLYGEHAL